MNTDTRQTEAALDRATRAVTAGIVMLLAGVFLVAVATATPVTVAGYLVGGLGGMLLQAGIVVYVLRGT